MKEVIAIVRPERWAATVEAARQIGCETAFHHRVLGRGRQRGLRYLRPSEGGRQTEMSYMPKRMLSWLLPDHAVSTLVSVILDVNQTGHNGDGKVFVCPVESPVAPSSEVSVAAAVLA